MPTQAAKICSSRRIVVNFFDGNLARIPGGGRTAENEAEALTLGVSWYPNQQTRLMFNSTTYWYDNTFPHPVFKTSAHNGNVYRGRGDRPLYPHELDAYV